MCRVSVAAHHARVPDGCPLTNAEYEVMSMYAQGQFTSEICFATGRASSTVRGRVNSANRRLGTTSRTQSLMLMKDSGWLGAPPRRPNEQDPPLSHSQMLYLKAFDVWLRDRSSEAQAALTICFAAMCWESNARPVRRPVDTDDWLLSMGRRLTSRLAMAG